MAERPVINWSAVCNCAPVKVAHRHGRSPDGTEHLQVLMPRRLR